MKNNNNTEHFKNLQYSRTLKNNNNTEHFKNLQYNRQLKNTMIINALTVLA